MPPLIPIVPLDRPIKRLLPTLCALAITLAYAFFLYSYFAPAPGRPGIDENAYILAGANLAQSHDLALRPPDNYAFVGAMWVQPDPPTTQPTAAKYLPHFLAPHIEQNTYYPKYPAGLPLLNAAAIQLLGNTPHAREQALLLSPICTALAVLGMFFLARPFVGPYLALCAQIVLATTYTTLVLADLPNSHAPALAAVTWGFVALFSWLHTGQLWRGIIAGLLLGAAVTLRYSEALLLFPLYSLDQVLADTPLQHTHPHLWTAIKCLRFLPLGALGIATLFALKRRPRPHVGSALEDRLSPSPGTGAYVSPGQRIGSPSAHRPTFLTSALRPLTSLLPLLAWSLPVGLLVLYNYHTLASPTGYDVTHESAAFTSAEFLQKWDFTLHQLYLYGLFLFLPLTFAGLLLMFRTSPKHALILSLWLLPPTLLYTAYYWGNRAPGVAYLRFFLTLFPAYLLPAFHLLHQATTARGPLQPEPSTLAVPSPSSSRLPSRPSRLRGFSNAILSPLPAALLTVTAAAVGLTAAQPELARQHRGNLNLAYSTRELLQLLREKTGTGTVSRSRTGTGTVSALLTSTLRLPPSPSSPLAPLPILFADDGLFPQLLMHLQYVLDDPDVYTTTAFDPLIGGGFGIIGFAQQHRNDNNAPIPLQQARVDAMTQFRATKSDQDLLHDFRTTVDTALQHHRPVYALLTPAQHTAFTQRYTNQRYTLNKLATWAEPCNTALPAGRLNNSPLAPPDWSGEPFIRWYPQSLTLYQLLPLQSPTTHPASPIAHAP